MKPYDQSRCSERPLAEQEAFPMGRALVRGAGDLATGVIQALVRAGYAVVALEVKEPSAIRWTVALCHGLQLPEGERHRVEDLMAYPLPNAEAVLRFWRDRRERPVAFSSDPVYSLEPGFPSTEKESTPLFPVPILVDPHMESLNLLQPDLLVDAIIAKRNLGLSADLADRVIALGPGFEAPHDADIVIETARGHHLGRLIRQGRAKPNTGVPGSIAGATHERVLHAPRAGKLDVLCSIGSIVAEGDPIAQIEDCVVRASLTGVIRGMLPQGSRVFQGMKMADIDPRAEAMHYCMTISDKSRSLGAAVLAADLLLQRERKVGQKVQSEREPHV